ncbi:MAG TPA: Crp/Fnr family transcriptional regulator [Bacteroidia bacterium]|nr:Crp/Fnr family transcriptional regulator [Bacteroidia bacterium]
MIGFSKIYASFSSVISFTEEEIKGFLPLLSVKNFKKKDIMLQQNNVADSVFFINSGLTRNFITNSKGEEITTHFTIEGDYVTEYASFLTLRRSTCSVQALEDVEAVVLNRDALQYGYEKVKDGNKLGRIIAETYFMMAVDKLEEMYSGDILERFDKLNETFPGIHQRVPQHMIASYLGITPVHLSRLKSAQVQK